MKKTTSNEQLKLIDARQSYFAAVRHTSHLLLIVGIQRTIFPKACPMGLPPDSHTEEWAAWPHEISQTLDFLSIKMNPAKIAFFPNIFFRNMAVYATLTFFLTLCVKKEGQLQVTREMLASDHWYSCGTIAPSSFRCRSSRDHERG